MEPRRVRGIAPVGGSALPKATSATHTSTPKEARQKAPKAPKTPKATSTRRRRRLKFAKDLELLEPMAPDGPNLEAEPGRGILRLRPPPPPPGAAASVAEYQGHPQALQDFVSRLHLDVWRGQRMSTMLQQVLSVVLSKALFERLRGWRRHTKAAETEEWSEADAWRFWCRRGDPGSVAYVDWWRDTRRSTEWPTWRAPLLAESQCHWLGAESARCRAYPGSELGPLCPGIPDATWKAIWPHIEVRPLPPAVKVSLTTWLVCCGLTMLAGLYAENMPLDTQDVFHHYASHSPTFQQVLNQLAVQW